MLSGIDLKLRFYVQGLVNVLGTHLRVSRQMLIINLTFVHVGLLAWGTTTYDSWALDALTVLTVVIALGVAHFSVENLKKEMGEELNWIIFRFFRLVWMWFFPLSLLNLWIFVMAGGIDNLRSFISSMAIGLSYWVATCKEAPPKVKKEAKKLAHAYR